jgi:hypothetical protein
VTTSWFALAKAGHWPLSRLVAGATSLALARVVAWSTIRILSATGMGFSHGGSHG